MAEMNAVVGYVPDAVAKTIGSKRPTKPLEILLEPGSAMHVRIGPEDVAGVLMGASQKGQTSVQVLLNDKATVETFVRGPIGNFLKPIRDFSTIVWKPPLVSIYVHPQLLDKLVALNKESIRLG
jgi:hypothetical protein